MFAVREGMQIKLVVTNASGVQKVKSTVKQIKKVKTTAKFVNSVNMKVKVWLRNLKDVLVSIVPKGNGIQHKEVPVCLAKIALLVLFKTKKNKAFVLDVPLVITVTPLVQ